MLQHVPGLCLLEGVWVEPSAADRGQECRLNQRRILGFGRHGQFQEVKPRWVTADVYGPSLGGDVVPPFTLPPLMGLDRAQKTQMIQVGIGDRAVRQVSALAGGEQVPQVVWLGLKDLAQVVAGHAVH